MNKQRRKILNEVVDKLEKLEGITDHKVATAIVSDCADQTEDCMDEEQFALDSRPESLYWSSGNQDMTDNVSDLSDAYADLDTIRIVLESESEFKYQEHRAEITSAINSIVKAIHR